MKWFLRIIVVFFKELVQLCCDWMIFGMVVMIFLIQLVLFGYVININIWDILVVVVDQSQIGFSWILVQMVEVIWVVEVMECYVIIVEVEEVIMFVWVCVVFILLDDFVQCIVCLFSVGLGLLVLIDEEISWLVV